ncbi:MAG: hypothetical protein K0U84_24615 [Actinomycetia bacterium]|nr:hypothetical protein [Actinomycetes bacterium]
MTDPADRFATADSPAQVWVLAVHLSLFDEDAFAERARRLSVHPSVDAARAHLARVVTTPPTDWLNNEEARGLIARERETLRGGREAAEEGLGYRIDPAELYQ